VWTIEIERGIAAPLTRNPANDWHPVWSTDGTQLLFNSDRAGKSEGVLYRKSALDASADETQVLIGWGYPTDWSRDGRWAAIVGPRTGAPDLASGAAQIVSMSDHSVKPLLDTPSRNGAVRFSPDGKWVAYTSEETGRFEVFVRPFANGMAAGAKIQVSELGGDYPVWRADGQELYFMSEDASIYALPTGSLRIGGPVARTQRLFRPCPGSGPQSAPMTAQFWGNPYDTRDGKRFIVNCAVRRSREYVALMNWPLAQNR
jgi:Tol biopolymer transport system component